MDDVTTRPPDQDLGVDRDDHLTAGDDRRRHASAALLDRVVDFPPPLLTGDVDDTLGVVGLGQRQQGADRRDGDADEDERRQDRQGDLDLLVAVGLLRDGLPAVAEAPHHIADDGEHDDAHDAGDGKHRPLQVVDVLGVLTRGRPCVLGRILRTAGEGETPGDQCEQAHGSRTR